jgi:predicted Na+-dependent transporter
VIDPQRRGAGAEALGSWLEKWLLAGVLVTAAAGVALPGPGRWADRHDGINVALVTLVVASGLGIPPGSVAALRRLAARLVVVVVVVAVVLPLLADGLAHLLAAGPLREGVLSVGVAPAEVASIGLSGLAGGDVAVAAVLLGASTLVSVISAGPILSVFGGGGVSPGHVVVQLALIVAAPLAVGLLARPIVARSPEGAGPSRWAGRRIDPAVPGVVATLAVVILVALVAAQVHLAAAYLAVTGVLAALILISAGGGALLGRWLPPAAGRSTLLHVSMRDFAIASGIAAAAFGAGATGPLGIYGVLVMAWGTLVAKWATRRASPPRGPLS